MSPAKNSLVNPAPRAASVSKAPADTRRKSRLSLALWWFLVAASLANVWPFMAYDHVPFADYPSHLFKAAVIRHYHDPALHYAEHFRINFVPPPNVLCEYLTAGAATVMSIDHAGKLVMALTLALLPLSLWFWLSRSAPGNECWAVLGLTMTWSTFAYWGNENFCFGTALLFFLLGALAKWQGEGSGARVAACTVLATVMYFTHFLVFFLAGAAVGIHLLVGRWRSPRAWVNHVMVLAPGALLGAMFFGRGGPANDHYNWQPTVASTLTSLAAGLQPFPWVMSSQKAWWVALCFAAGAFLVYCAVVSWRTGRRFPAAFCLALILPAALMGEWFVIYIPNLRFWWIFALAALALLPQLTERAKLMICLAGLALAAGTSIDAARLFHDAEQRAAVAESAFAQFPSHLKLAPLVAPDLPDDLHRVFEYYHIRRGGVGPHHLVGPENSVAYRHQRPPQHAKHIYAFGLEGLTDWLDWYDGVLIVCTSDSRPTADQMVQALAQKGYLVRSDPPFALLLSPAYVAAHPHPEP